MVQPLMEVSKADHRKRGKNHGSGEVPRNAPGTGTQFFLEILEADERPK